MLRILATLVFLTALALGQSGYGGFADAAHADSKATFTTENISGEPGDGEGSDCPGLLHDCCHSSCPQTSLVKSRVLPDQADDGSAANLALNEVNPRSKTPDHDPPVPRFVI